MIHPINSRARVRVCFEGFIPRFILEYRLRRKLGPFRWHQWVTINEVESYSDSDSVLRSLSVAAVVLLSAQFNSEARKIRRQLHQQELGIRLQPAPHTYQFTF